MKSATPRSTASRCPSPPPVRIRWTPTCGAAVSKLASSRIRGTSRRKTRSPGRSIRALRPKSPPTSPSSSKRVCKSRELYEAPAAIVLHTAHSALEGLTLSREQRRFKEIVAHEMAQLIYDGRMFSGHYRDLSYYVASTQQFVTGSVRMRLLKGQAVAVGRRSPESLYDFGLATYETGDQFDHDAAVSFIKLFSQGLRTQARIQLGAGSMPEIRSLVAPTIEDENQNNR